MSWKEITVAVVTGRREAASRALFRIVSGLDRNCAQSSTTGELTTLGTRYVFYTAEEIREKVMGGANFDQIIIDDLSVEMFPEKSVPLLMASLGRSQLPAFYRLVRAEGLV